LLRIGSDLLGEDDIYVVRFSGVAELTSALEEHVVLIRIALLAMAGGIMSRLVGKIFS